MLEKISDNDLAAIGKSKVTLTLNKPAYIYIYIWHLSKVLVHEFHDDYIKNRNGNNSRLSFSETDSWFGVWNCNRRYF